MYLVKSFDEVQVGDRVDITKTITDADAALYSAATGDFGPVHFDDGYARNTRFGERIAPGIMVAGIATSVLTSRLVGVLGVSIEDRFWFTGPVRYGDTITVEVWIATKSAETRTVVWRASARNQDGAEVLGAEATLKFPRRKPAAAWPATTA
jgi:3-hydroxybutyryl-CoA dehydratase